jgi:TetR/AcrR family transcriptional regulator, transcriptional repressor of bet genes
MTNSGMVPRESRNKAMKMSNTDNTRSKDAAARPARTESKEVRRQQLINATIESIAKHGITGTTMTTVTRFAGLSIGLVNFHFKTKHSLFEETLRFVAEEHREQWKKNLRKASMAPTDKLLAIVDAHFHPKICNRKKLAVWFGFYGEVAYRATYRDLMTGIDTERWDVSIDLCNQLVADGGYDGIDGHGVANTLEGLYDGFCLNILMYPREFSRADAKREIRNYLATTFPKHFERLA